MTSVPISRAMRASPCALDLTLMAHFQRGLVWRRFDEEWWACGGNQHKPALKGDHRLAENLSVG